MTTVVPPIRCRDSIVHEREVFNLKGAAALGTWMNIRGVNLDCCPHGHRWIWRQLSCSCTVAVPL